MRERPGTQPGGGGGARGVSRLSTYTHGNLPQSNEHKAQQQAHRNTAREGAKRGGRHHLDDRVALAGDTGQEEEGQGHRQLSDLQFQRKVHPVVGEGRAAKAGTHRGRDNGQREEGHNA